jgi:hypothetical protein
MLEGANSQGGTMSKKPAHEIRLGKIRAAIWRNGENGKSWFSVTLSKIYTDADGKWKDTTSFHRDDLPLLCKVVDLAHSWCFDSRAEEAENAEVANG